MSHEQNMDDILKLLKNAVEEEKHSSAESAELLENSGEQASDMSEEKLKSELKKIFLQDTPLETDNENNNTENSYSLDDDFLKESAASWEQNRESERAPDTDGTEEKSESSGHLEKTEEVAEPAVSKEKEDAGIPIEPLEIHAMESRAPEIAPWEEDMPAVPENMEFFEKDADENTKNETEPDDGIESGEVFENGTEENAESEADHSPGLEVKKSGTSDNLFETEDFFEDMVESFFEDGFDPDQETAAVEMPETISLKSMDDSGAELLVVTSGLESPLPTESEIQMPSEADGAAETAESLPEEKEEEEQDGPDSSVLELLKQFGYQQEELEEAFGEEYVAPEDETAGFPDPGSFACLDSEYCVPEQKEEFRDRYRRQWLKSLFCLIGAGIFTLVLFFYDLLPLFEVPFDGMIDYDTYPIAYSLVGLQFLVFNCLLCPLKLWKGLKNAVCFRSDHFSPAAVLVPTVMLYDILCFAVGLSERMPSYHFLASALIFVTMLGDFFLLCRERNSFLVYSSSETGNYYTLLTDSGSRSFAERMIRGGLMPDKKICIPAHVPFPNRYSEATGENIQPPLWMRCFLVPALFCATVTAVVCMIAGQEMSDVFHAWMLVYLCLLPFGYGFVRWISLYLSHRRLAKRGCVFAGEGAVKRYADTDLIVFRDRHLLAGCHPKDIGITFYDPSKSLTILGCLNSLYSAIGGPLNNAFSELPAEYQYNKLKILRIFSNGIEAIVEDKHLLIVGTPEFMERYGFVFPAESGSKAGRGRTVLCVSLNRRNAAKLSIKYRVEPMFELLINRLAAEGVFCAVETFDPLVTSAYIASLRTKGHAPVSVLHKNVADFYRREERDIRREPTGLIVKDSRLKLAEAVVWAKRIIKGRRRALTGVLLTCFLGGMLAILLSFFGVQNFINQFSVLLFWLFSGTVIFLCLTGSFPKKEDFSLEDYERKMAEKQETERRKIQKNKDHTKDKKKNI